MTEHVVNLKEVEATRGGHSIFAPSASAMWANCSGSLVPNLYAKDNAKEDAATGTVAHDVAQRWLQTGTSPDHLIGTTQTLGEGDKQFTILIDASMLEYVGQYVDWCRYLPGVHFVETKVDFSDLTPIKNQRGTADHAACEPGKLTITDLKFGQGVKVFAFENTQALLYAWGFFRKYDELYDFQDIVIRIAQPRLDHFDEWVITREELIKWAAWLKERAYAAWCQDAPRSPSIKACRWCKISKGCAAHVVFNERLIDGVFDNLDAPVTAEQMEDLGTRLDSGMFTMSPMATANLTTAQKALLLPYRRMIESWFSDLHADLEQRCLDGERVPGYKIVEGKSNRVFTNDDEAAALLDFLGLPDEEIHPRGMISPAQAEIALTKAGFKRKALPNLLNQVVRKPPGKPSLVEESDKRPASASVVGSTFTNVDEEL